MNAINQTTSQRRVEASQISVVLPVFNEAGVLEDLHEQLVEVLAAERCRFEILFVNDGSTDDTPTILANLAARDARVRVLQLSRNFGQQAAVKAGLDHATGDAVVLMDSSLQDNPVAIHQFLRCWEHGYDVVYAIRHGGKKRVVQRFLCHVFSRVLNGRSSIRLSMDADNFSLIDRGALDALRRLMETDRDFPGLRSWLGFRQVGVPIERGQRDADQTRDSTLDLIRRAKCALFSFSTVPLTIFYAIAAMSLIAGLGIAAFALYHKLFTGLAVGGWASLTMIVSFFGALNSIGIAIIGEYAVEILDQVRARPTYLIDKRQTFPATVDVTPRDVEIMNWVSNGWSPDTEEQHVSAEPDEFRELLEQFR